MSAPKLATTTFQAGPDDKLAVIDVYEKEGSGVVNSFQETHGDAIDVLDTLAGGGEKPKDNAGNGEGGGDEFKESDPYSGDNAPNNDSSDLTGGLDGAPDVGSAGEAERLANSDPDYISDIDDLDENVREGMCFRGDSTDEVFYDIEPLEDLEEINDYNWNPAKIVKGVNFRSVKSVNNIINRLSGGAVKGRITDVGGMASLIASSAIQGSRMGMPNVFNAITRGKINKTILARAVGVMIPSIVAKANIPLLNDIARSPFGPMLPRVAPGIIGNTIKAIARPTGMPQNQYGQYYGNVRDTFDRIDPNWNKTSYGNRQVLNGTVVSSNEFMTEAMYANVSTRPLQIKSQFEGNGYYNESDIYYNNPSTFDRDLNTGGYQYDRQGVVVQQDPSIIYDRRTQSRRDDSFMVAATAFSASTVESYLKKKFSKTNAKVNRSTGWW